MVGDNDIDTSVSVRTDVRDSSINNSVFYNSSISIDVISLICVVGILFLVIGLFLRLVKRISVLESEITVILRLLRRSQVFSEESMCWVFKRQKNLFSGPAQEKFKTFETLHIFQWKCLQRGFSQTADPALNFCFASKSLFGPSAEIWGMSWLRLQLSESEKVLYQQEYFIMNYSSESA